tara:strand:- start:3232 stop:4212 length:981 start_codon:yes stop_codon:yes gene_type:complete
VIISKTPYRISLLGGGTDYPSWYKLNNGQVLSFTIDKYVYITFRPLPNFFGHKLRLVYSKIENVQSSDKLIHPTAKQILKYHNIKKGFEIHYDGDLPSHSGLGSSSCFSVGLINAISAYKKIKYSKYDLAKTAIKIEQELVRETVGSQDQINASFGGFNHIKFFKNKKFSVNKISLSNNRLKKFEDNLLLFYTGQSRMSQNIANSYIHNKKIRDKYFYNIHDTVNQGLTILKNGSLDDFGRLLNYYWNQKKQLSNKISNDYIDSIYTKAIKAGALGGKITGAGGGGFILFYAPKDKHVKLRKVLKKLLHVPFKFEKKGSSIIHHSY